jgi:hypothetical protein
MAGNSFEFRYKVGDVAAAQRLRFLHSPQMKYLIILWVLILLYVAAPLIVPAWFPNTTNASWVLVIEVVAAFAMTLAVMIFISPLVDFAFGRHWHLPLTLHFNEKQLRVYVTGKTGGLRLAWGEILRVEENKQVYTLHYGTGNKYLILPKAAFPRPQDEQRFHDLLNRRASLPAKLEPEEEEEKVKE